MTHWRLAVLQEDPLVANAGRYKGDAGDSVSAHTVGMDGGR